MQYRVAGKTGLKLSALTFGCMRLPKKEDAEGNKSIDYDASHALFRRAMELGVNTFDTACVYNGGDSEKCIGAFLPEIRREDLIISTKNPVGSAYFRLPGDQTTRDLWRAHLEEELGRLGSDHIDLYLFHDQTLLTFRNLGMAPKGYVEQARKAKEEGLIRHIGFSSHDTCGNVKKIIEMSEGALEFMIIQYNLLDRQYADAIAHAAEQGLGVGVMGPVGGGRLVHPSDVYAKATGASSTPEAAFRFVLANPHVTTALSGMNALEQVEENAATASRPDALTATELEAIGRLEEQNRELLGLYCTGCGYCMPCTHGVDIPGNFRAMNTLKVNGLVGLARQTYKRLGDAAAAHCKQCGACEGKCPQDIDIPLRLEEVAAAFAGE